MLEAVATKLRAYAEALGRGYPDWALRYLPVKRRLAHVNWEHARILEIGANANGLSRFCSARIVAVDAALEHLVEARAAQQILPVAADIEALPFPDHAFDVVVCLDVFEHIPYTKRPSAADEIVRVLAETGHGVVGFPSGTATVAAEERIRDAYQRRTGGTIRWLEEHIENGLPNPSRVLGEFREATGKAYGVRRTDINSLFVWVWTWKVLMCGWPGCGNVLFQVVLRWLAPLLSRIHVGRRYRTMIWIEPRTQDE